MEIVCERCGHTGAAGSVTVQNTDVVVTCAACGAQARLGGTGDTPGGVVGDTLEANTPSSSPSSPLPPTKCPKCGHRQHDEYACHKCGLVFARARRGDRPWEQPPPGKERAVRQADELWAAVEAAPGDVAGHERLVSFCRAAGISDWASIRYRYYTADHPADALFVRFRDQAIADAQSLAGALVQRGGVSAAEASRGPKQVLLVVTFVIVVVVIAGLVRGLTAVLALE